MTAVLKDAPSRRLEMKSSKDARSKLQAVGKSKDGVVILKQVGGSRLSSAQINDAIRQAREKRRSKSSTIKKK